jgi:SAM-dependent methyltransferase
VHGEADDIGQEALCVRLVRSVPDAATRVLVVGATPGLLAAELKAGHPGRVVLAAIEGDATPAPEPEGLDALFAVDLQHDDLGVEEGSVDAIVYADTLPRLADPLTVLERHRRLLAPSGTIVCSLPNLQHFSVVSLLLRGMFPYQSHTLVDPSYLRLFTAASAIDLLLDAGYAPDLVDRVEAPGADALITAGAAVFELLGVGPSDAQRAMNTAHMILRGEALPEVDEGPEVPITFVACVNDEAQLEANLLRSPDVSGAHPHQILLFRGCANAAEGLNAGIEQADGELVVLVHQDVYLPKGWVRRMVAQWHRAGERDGSIGVAGVFGVADRRVAFDAIGHVVHRERLLTHGVLPADVDGLDELLMVVPRDTPLRVEPGLGWHLYGTDLALQAHHDGRRVVVLDAPCHHDSLTGRVPVSYRDSERVLARKWSSMLPIHTNLSSIGAWLLDQPETITPSRPPEDGEGHAEQVAGLVDRLRAERSALTTELEQARHQVASMQASPFWRARELFVRLRDRKSRS